MLHFQIDNIEGTRLISQPLPSIISHLSHSMSAHGDALLRIVIFPMELFGV